MRFHRNTSPIIKGEGIRRPYPPHTRSDISAGLYKVSTLSRTLGRTGTLGGSATVVDLLTYAKQLAERRPYQRRKQYRNRTIPIANRTTKRWKNRGPIMAARKNQ